VRRDRALTILHRLGAPPLAESVGDNIQVECERAHAANAYRLASCLAEVIDSTYGRRATGHITEKELDALKVAIYASAAPEQRPGWGCAIKARPHPTNRGGKRRLVWTAERPAYCDSPRRARQAAKRCAGSQYRASLRAFSKASPHHSHHAPRRLAPQSAPVDVTTLSELRFEVRMQPDLIPDAVDAPLSQPLDTAQVEHLPKRIEPILSRRAAGVCKRACACIDTPHSG
jgi:hypothetical protein